jgi:hypothetical protein
MPSLQENHRGPEQLPPIHDAERLASIHRPKFGEILKSQDFASLEDLRKMFRALNPERAEGFLDRILAIDTRLSDEAKTKALFEILEKYSKHTVPHCKETGSIVRMLMRHQAKSALGQADLGNLAKAIERHDFGKLGMRDSTLNRPRTSREPFTPQEELEKMAHPALGLLIMKALRFKDSLSGRIALTHHLKYKTNRDGGLAIVGYPIDDTDGAFTFFKYCDQNGLRRELTPEDQVASFVDVYSALTDPSRPSDPFEMKKNASSSDEEIAESALKKMDTKIFGDPYYQTGAGAPLYQAFKDAILEEIHDHPKRLAA